MDLGKTEDFAFYDHVNNRYQIKGDLVRLGYWRLSVIAKEVKNGRTYTYNKQFYIRVLDLNSISPDNPIVPIDPDTGEPIIPQYLDKDSLVREAKD